MSNKKISSYFIFTFLISWILWSPFYFLENLNEFWVLPGAWGPTMAAILLTYYNKGKIGIKRLLQKVLIWKVPLRLYIFAIFILLLVGSITVLMHKLVGGNFPDTGAILNGMGLEKGQWGASLITVASVFFNQYIVGRTRCRGTGMERVCAIRTTAKVQCQYFRIDVGFFMGYVAFALDIVHAQGSGKFTCTGLLSNNDGHGRDFFLAVQ